MKTLLEITLIAFALYVVIDMFIGYSVWLSTGAVSLQVCILLAKWFLSVEKRVNL